MKPALKLLLLMEDYSFASSQFKLPKEVLAVFKDIQSKVSNEDWIDEGKETEPHLTMMYGITGGLKSKRLLLKFFEDIKWVEAKLGDLEIFSPKGDGKYEVLVIKVVSPELHRLRKKLEKAVPNEQTFPTYKPHITIGYLKPGEGKKYLESKYEKIDFTLKVLQYSTKEGSKTDIPLIQK
jgi:2'-5' RNA ligase